MAILSILGLYLHDETVLQPLLDNLPEELDPEAVGAEILVQCAELEILYPDPGSFKEILRYWAAGQLPVWLRKSEALKAAYNITENYDRSEEWTDTGNSSSKNNNYFKGYPVTSDMVKQNSSDGESHAGSTHKGRVHGNIGVRSAQELVEQELQLADKANLQQQIVEDFKNRFCLLVY